FCWGRHHAAEIADQVLLFRPPSSQRSGKETANRFPPRTSGGPVRAFPARQAPVRVREGRGAWNRAESSSVAGRSTCVPARHRASSPELPTHQRTFLSSISSGGDQRRD